MTPDKSIGSTGSDITEQEVVSRNRKSRVGVQTNNPIVTKFGMSLEESPWGCSRDIGNDVMKPEVTSQGINLLQEALNRLPGYLSEDG